MATKKAVKKAATKSPAVKKTTARKSPKKKNIGRPSKPLNMQTNEPTVGKGKKDEAVPAMEKRVKTKTVVAGKKKQVKVPVRTGTGGGRTGGGATGELTPARDTAAGRGYGKKRTKR